MDIDISFLNHEQEIFYWSKARNNRFGGGFGNGKTFVACQRALTMLLTFSGYRYAIGRQVYKNLRATTMQTFFKICPQELIYKHDENYGITILKNSSVVYWIHLDAIDEATAKGFEINSLLIDQVEEVKESIYLLMDSRVGRWDKAKVPEELLLKYPQWPRHPTRGFPLVPNYVDVLDNPSDDEYHFVSRYYDEDSIERKKNHFSVVRQTDDSMNDAATIEQIKGRDEEWVNKYYYGKKGKSSAIIHRVPAECVLDSETMNAGDLENLLNLIKAKGNLFRVLDHGESSPTCCAWAASLNKVHIFFGEYYMPNEVVSVHRKNIIELSEVLCGEGNKNNYTDFSDPAIMKKTLQNKTKLYTVADEYMDTDEIDAPPIFWIGADNNEFGTRNRINELLKPSLKFSHPITKVSPAPGIYFIQRSEKYPHGCHNIIIETKRQRRVLLDSIDGKNIYSDERDGNIPDHGYDTVRYYVAMHNSGKADAVRQPPRRSFAGFKRLRKMREQFVGARA